jgi:sugar O-acyltransferase (sialic acid O-acetyltransferase NeuD family)
MTKKIFIFGAGSYGRVLLRDIYDINDKEPTWEVLGYVDNDPELIDNIIDGYLVYKHENLPQSNDYYGICGVGDPKIRKKIVCTEIEPKGYTLPTIIHPTVIKSSDFIAGAGCVIRSGVTIHFDVQLGKCVWLDCNILLGHGGRLGEYASMFPSSTITGDCTIGRNSIIGAGCTLHQGVKVGNDSLVGIGTTIINDVPDNTSVTDFPRKIVKDI